MQIWSCNTREERVHQVAVSEDFLPKREGLGGARHKDLIQRLAARRAAVHITHFGDELAHNFDCEVCFYPDKALTWPQVQEEARQDLVEKLAGPSFFLGSTAF